MSGLCHCIYGCNWFSLPCGKTMDMWTLLMYFDIRDTTTHMHRSMRYSVIVWNYLDVYIGIGWYISINVETVLVWMSSIVSAAYDIGLDISMNLDILLAWMSEITIVIITSAAQWTLNGLLSYVRLRRGSGMFVSHFVKWGEAHIFRRTDPHSSMTNL